MSWKEHTDYIRGKVCKVIDILNKYRYFLPTSVKLVLYISLFYSYLCYARLVWGPINTSNINKLRLLQKNPPSNSKCVVLAFSLTLYYKYRIQDVSIISYQRLLSTHCFAVKNNNYLFLELVDFTPYTSFYPTRYKGTWLIPSSRANFGHQRLKHTIPFILNYVIYINVNLIALIKKRLTDIVI